RWRPPDRPNRHSAGFEARPLDPLDLCALDNDGYGKQHEAQLPARAGIAAVKLCPTDHPAVTAGFVANKTVLPGGLIPAGHRHDRPFAPRKSRPVVRFGQVRTDRIRPRARWPWHRIDL